MRRTPAAGRRVASVALVAATLVPGVGLPQPLHALPYRAPDVASAPIPAASVIVVGGPGDGWGLVAADGSRYRSVGQPPLAGNPRLSPDGRAVAWWVRTAEPRRGENLGPDQGTYVGVRRLADGGWTELHIPGARGGDVQWYPDGRRLLVAGFTAEGVAGTWEVRVDSGATRLLCACGARLLVSSAGALAHVAGSSHDERYGPPPPGVVRLPRPAEIAGMPVLRPDGRAYAARSPHAAVLRVVDAAGVVRDLPVTGAGDLGADEVIAWSRDGIWLSVRGRGLALVDPATGSARWVVTGAMRDTRVWNLALAIATGARTVAAAEPPPPEAPGRRAIDPGAAAGIGLTVSALVGLLAALAYRTWRMRATRSAPAHAGTHEKANGGR